MDNRLPTPDDMLWIDRPDAPAIAAKRTTDPWLLARFDEFERDGFCLLSGAVDASLCDALVACYRRWCGERGDAAPADDYGHRPRLINFHLASQAARRVFTGNDQALRLQDFLFGFPASIYTSLTFNVGTEQPLHRDVPLFWTTPASHYFGVWTALEDVDENNGPLSVMVGGHKLGIDHIALARQRYADLGAVPSFSKELWDDYQTSVTHAGRTAGLEERVVRMKKGDTLIWHALAPHGGTPIADPQRTRFSIVFHTVPQGLAVYHGDVFYNPDHPRNRTVESGWLYRCEQGRMYPMLGDPHFSDN